MDWDEIYEELQNELGKEPTDEEVQEKYEDICSHTYDRDKDFKKYGG